MRERILALTMVVVISLGISPVFAALKINPYEGFSTSQISDYKCDKPAFSTSGLLGGLWPGDWANYKDIDFGKTEPTSVDLWIGAPKEHAGITELRLDSPNGPLVAKFTAVPSDFREPLKHTVEIVLRFTGVHDLYIMSSKGTHAYYDIQFNKPETDDKFRYSEYTGEPAFSDIAGNPHSSAISIITSLGLIDSEPTKRNFFPELGVARSEVATAFYRILAGESAGYFPGIAFQDIDPSSGYADAVNYLYSNEIIKGTDTYLFQPDSYITMQDALTIACRALGYGDLAELKGGYPYGYMIIAAEQKLTSGIKSDGNLRRGEFARLMHNVINADFLDISSIRNGDLIYQKAKGILSKACSIYRARGIVTANYLTSLYSPQASVLFNEVIVNGAVYKVGTTDAAAMLGMDCEFYYHDNNDIRTMVAILPSGGVEILDVEDYGEGEVNISAAGVTYYKDHRSGQIDFGPGTNIIFNGVALDQRLDDVLDPNLFKGSVRAIDNGSGYETVFINNYFNIIVEAYNASSLTLKDRLSGQIISVDENENTVIITKGGVKSRMKDLEAGDVAAVYLSRSAKGRPFVRIYAGGEDITGSVSEISDDFVYVDGKPFKVASECTDTVKLLGFVGRFSINIYGEIVTFKASSGEGSMSIGFIMEVGIKRKGLNSTLEMRIFGEDNKVSVYESAEKVVVDAIPFNLSGSDIESVWSWLSTVNMRTVVRYLLNENGKIAKLDTYLEGNRGPDDVLKMIGTPRQTYLYAPTRNIIATGGKGVARLQGSTGTLIMYYNDGSDERLYYKGPFGNNIDATMRPVGDLYSSTGEDYVADVFVWNVQDPMVSWKDPFIFDKITRATNQNGELIHNIYGYSGPSYVTYILPDEINVPGTQIHTIFANVQKGDWIRVKPNRMNEIILAEIIMTHDIAPIVAGITPVLNPSIYFSGSTDIQDFNMLYGRVIENNDGYLAVQHGGRTGNLIEVINTSLSAVTKIERNEKGEVSLTPSLKIGNVSKDDIVAVLIIGTARQVIILPDDSI
ncbi:MAG: carbohydrate-binding protein [Firmicutes bacterium]|nr:carbohydrate-binding protein [Bacillota bacterium]